MLDTLREAIIQEIAKKQPFRDLRSTYSVESLKWVLQQIEKIENE